MSIKELDHSIEIKNVGCSVDSLEELQVVAMDFCLNSRTKVFFF
jgi:hypothetical protein